MRAPLHGRGRHAVLLCRLLFFSTNQEVIMAKTNFQYEKRQRELEKKKKAEEKARRKLDAKHTPGGEDEQMQSATDEVATPETSNPA